MDFACEYAKGLEIQHVSNNLGWCRPDLDNMFSQSPITKRPIDAVSL